MNFKNMKAVKTVQKGFTLIELMIVVAIIGILAAVAIPAYQDYISRAQVSEAVELLAGLKVDVVDYYGQKGTLPTLTQLETFAGTKVKSGKYTSTMTGATGGTYIATFKATGVGANIVSKTVELVYTTAAGGKFVCQTGATNGVPIKYLPGACK